MQKQYLFLQRAKPLEYKETYNTRDESETEMMYSRWVIFMFHHKIQKEKIMPTKAYTSCFSKLTELILASEIYVYVIF